MHRKQVTRLESQRGAVLIVALVLLLVLTVLGTASVRDTTMAERMAGNFRDYSSAIEAAESALRVGEEGIANATTFATMSWDSSDGTSIVQPTSTSLDPNTDGNFARTVPADVLTHDSKLLVASAPRYYIEQLPEIELSGSDISEGVGAPVTIHYYRVTAKGYGVSPNTEVVLQSTYFDWNGNGN
ncbi:MAG: pilus assembly protein [Gammaproteobacteria bacterium]|nr:pilus assembly protein [Gammaproteobacteria bacterium]